MNKKCKKIGMGLSGLMCAGLLFSCVLTSEAGNSRGEEECAHEHWKIMDRYESVQDDNDPYEHAIVEITELKCTACKTEVTVEEETGRESHDFTEYWDTEENCWAENCGRCNYTYYYH